MAETTFRVMSLQPTGPVLVGFSGGLDSTVLLHWLAGQASFRERGLRALHVQHDLHPDAGAWTEHCQGNCAALGIELLVAQVQVPRLGGLGLEGAAREVRREAFARQLRQGETLALAHHQDDQAETVLLRLLRASGSEGLGAMRERRPFAAGWLWRPLLQVPRAQLLGYAAEHRLRWIDDPSNADQGFDRNLLRHRILPALHERWPHANAALARSATLLAEDAELLRDEAHKRLEQVRAPEAATLSVAALLALERPWRTRVLREWLTELQVPALPGHAFETIDSNLLGARDDAGAEYQWAGQVLRRWRDWLHVEPLRDPLPPGWRCSWNGSGRLQLPTGDSLHFARTRPQPDAPTFNSDIRAGVDEPLGNFIVCSRTGGERIRLPGRVHSHALKQCLQDTGMPPWVRRRLPLLLAEDGALLAAGEQLLSAPFKQWCEDRFVQLVWTQPSGAATI
ncbi:MAG: tRNA lysidine(34) synthetase TilS [Arenimonas sp.]